jgi:hypothetical protein
MVIRALKPGRPYPAQSALGAFRLRGDNLASVVMTACGAQMVRPLEFAAIRALYVAGRGQRMMGSPHVAPRFRGFLLWNCHFQGLA